LGYRGALDRGVPINESASLLACQMPKDPATVQAK